jgi:hypothetical protein
MRTKVFVTQSGVFLEREFDSKENSGRTEELIEVQQPQIDTDMTEQERQPQGVVEPQSVVDRVVQTQEPHGSSRTRFEPEK